MNKEQKKEPVMLTPGALRVSPRVWQAAYSMQLNHRNPILFDALIEVEKNLKNILRLSDKYKIVFFVLYFYEALIMYSFNESL